MQHMYWQAIRAGTLPTHAARDALRLIDAAPPSSSTSLVVCPDAASTIPVGVAAAAAAGGPLPHGQSIACASGGACASALPGSTIACASTRTGSGDPGDAATKYEVPQLVRDLSKQSIGTLPSPTTPSPLLRGSRFSEVADAEVRNKAWPRRLLMSVLPVR